MQQELNLDNKLKSFSIKDPQVIKQRRNKQIVFLCTVVTVIVLIILLVVLRVRPKESTQNPYILSNPKINFSPISFPSVTPKTSSFIPSTSLSPQATTLTDFTILYPDLSWEKVQENKRYGIDSDILYFSSADNSILNEGIGLSGNEWMAEKEDFDGKEWLTVYEDIQMSYENQFKKIGWDYRFFVPQGRLSGIVADGPLGSAVGFVGVKNNQVRVLVIDNQLYLGPNGICPCVHRIWIYLSDIYSLGDILP